MDERKRERGTAIEGKSEREGRQREMSRDSDNINQRWSEQLDREPATKSWVLLSQGWILLSESRYLAI